MGKRSKARELAVQVLFHMEYHSGNPVEVFELISGNFGSSESVKDFSESLVCNVCNNLERLDDLIRRSSKNWRLERMSRVDRTILRLGVCEILFSPDVPPKVSIDEAVELGKKFGTEDSASFINGVMDNIFNSLSPDDVGPEKKQYFEKKG